MSRKEKQEERGRDGRRGQECGGGRGEGGRKGEEERRRRGGKGYAQRR